MNALLRNAETKKILEFQRVPARIDRRPIDKFGQKCLKGIKTVHEGRGQKMAKFCPRSC